MRKAYLFIAILALACTVLAGTALADHGYTSIDDIPMAVDFDVRVDLSDGGMPHIVTNYPFEKTGATEMNLVYNRGSESEVISLNYNYLTGETTVGTHLEEYEGDSFERAYREIRDGEITLDDNVYINTSHFGEETDWFLVYSLSDKSYTEYSERTYAQTFDGLGDGGVSRTAYYDNGNLYLSRTQVRKGDSDLLMEYSRAGELQYASIMQSGAKRGWYDYDPATKLFDGHRITELGFEESDMALQPLAFTEVRTETQMKEYADRIASDALGMARMSTRILGGVISGIIMGILLFYMIRRRRQDRKKEAAARMESAPASGQENGGAEETPESVEPPQATSSSAGM